VTPIWRCRDKRSRYRYGHACLPAASPVLAKPRSGVCKRCRGGLGLNEDVEHDIVLIHGAPKVMLHPLDASENLVEIPLVSWLWPASAQAVGKTRSEFLAPAPHSDQEQFDIQQTGAEDVVQPDSVTDDLGGEPMTKVRSGGDFMPPVAPAFGHAARLGCRDNPLLGLATTGRAASRPEPDAQG
jgi:hypothetical protein